MVRYNTKGMKIFNLTNYIILIIISLLIILPILHVFMGSLSDPVAYSNYGGLIVWPKGFSTEGYRKIFSSPEIWKGYFNTIFYTFIATLMGTLITTGAAYTLSRKGLKLKNCMMFFISFTMIFSGGMIPKFLVVYKLGLIDTRWAVILPSCVNAFYIIIMRTYFQSIPDSLEESAKLDGANNLRILFSIMIPLAKPSIAAISLFYAVYHWNSYFEAMLYLRNNELFPLQLVLRDILISNSGVSSTMSADAYNMLLKEIIKYGVIMVSIVPMLCIYPFIQKYFVGGIMIGAIKE